MHELAIARHLLLLVEAQAASAGAEKVTKVNLRLGEQSHVVPSSLATCFALLTSAHEGPARGARLVVARMPMWFACEYCTIEYPVREGAFRCPACRRAGRLAEPGDELVLESIEVI